MTIFDRLGKIYSEIDAVYAKEELGAHIKGFAKKETEYNLKRQLNDQAYFLFMFTRLEDWVKQLSDNLIAAKIASRLNWKQKRTWYIIDKRRDRMAFMDRVALLTEVTNKEYALVRNYYLQRNNIAHGGTFTVAIHMPTVITDMKSLYRSLKG